MATRSADAGLAAAREIAAGGALDPGTRMEVTFAPGSTLARCGVVTLLTSPRTLKVHHEQEARLE